MTALVAGCTADQKSSARRTPQARYVAVSSEYRRLLENVAHDPVVIANIREANRTNDLTQAQIDEIDRKWVASGKAGTLVMEQVLHNEAADYLRQVNAEHPEVVELFLIDSKGCVTAENIRTTDYWQGDEAKWSEVFVRQRGEYFVDDIEFDRSTQIYVHHYSIPIRDRDNSLIGVLVAGVAAEPTE